MGRVNNSLCWHCVNALINGCSWAASFKPVKGWNAQPRQLEDIGISYNVVSCPEFIQKAEYNKGVLIHDGIELKPYKL